MSVFNLKIVNSIELGRRVLKNIYEDFKIENISNTDLTLNMNIIHVKFTENVADTKRVFNK